MTKILFFRYCCNPCNPSLGSLEDISPAQIYILCRPHFPCFLPFLSCYLVSKCNIHFFILVFLNPTLFTSLSFPVFYSPCLLLSIFLPCLSFHILYFLFLSFLFVFYFLSCLPAFLLSFPSDFFCLSSNFSFCLYLFICVLLSFFAFFYFHPLPVFYYIASTLLFILLHIRVCVFCGYYYYCYYYFYLPVLLFCIFYLSFSCLPFLLIFFIFSTLFNYLVLILDFITASFIFFLFFL